MRSTPEKEALTRAASDKNKVADTNATCKRHDFVDSVAGLIVASAWSPARRHADGAVVAILLVIRVYALDAHNARVIFRFTRVEAKPLLVPVQNPARKGRYQTRSGLGCQNSLDKAENERDVSRDAVLAFKNLSSLDAFIRSGDLHLNHHPRLAVG